jgi:hypothetical protein
MVQPLDIIIIERLGGVKAYSVKDFSVDKLYTKCGFKKADNFVKQAEWQVKYDKNKYVIQLYAKSEGRANSENKYEFPPPVDNKLFFGSCAVVAQIKRDDNSTAYTHLTVAMWNKIYEKLYGGFEDLTALAKNDEDEEDDLRNVPKNMKTKNGGYLKDGFVVDSSDTEDESFEEEEEEEDAEFSEEQDDTELSSSNISADEGSELTEESYDYNDSDVGK